MNSHDGEAVAENIPEYQSSLPAPENFSQDPSRNEILPPAGCTVIGSEGEYQYAQLGKANIDVAGTCVIDFRENKMAQKPGKPLKIVISHQVALRPRGSLWR
jgi:hypothetical protein